MYQYQLATGMFSSGRNCPPGVIVMSISPQDYQSVFLWSHWQKLTI